MTRLMIGLFAAMLVLAVGCTSQPQNHAGEPKTPQAGMTPPVIDGELNDAIWAAAAPCNVAKLPGGKPAASSAVAMAAKDNDFFYVAFRCPEKPERLNALKADAAANDSDQIRADDFVAVFVDPTNERTSYYQVIINPGNVRWDAYHGSPELADVSWNPQIRSAVKTAGGYWMVEMAIPIKNFTHTARTSSAWAFNVSRNSVAEGETAYWSAPFENAPHGPDRFGTLQDMPVVELKK